MARFLSRGRARSAGLPPGSLEYVGDRPQLTPYIHLTDYTAHEIHSRGGVDVETCLSRIAPPSVTWIDIRGFGDLSLFRRLGEALHIHSLVLEDMLNTDQRPKVEDYGDYLFVVAKKLGYDGSDLRSEHVCILLGKGFVLTVQEDHEDDFRVVRERLEQGQGRIRGKAEDYLMYALLDSVVDRYYLYLEDFDTRVERLERGLLAGSPPDLQQVYGLKRNLVVGRKALWPLREVASRLESGFSDLITPDTRLFMRDVYDHLMQVMETVESFRELLGEMAGIYLSAASNRTNEVMKVLTIIATIFIPLTFIAGIYGMNFQHMPELDWPWAYPVILGLMALVAAGLVWFFKRRRWF
jgi:magnesium transporter